MPWNFEENYKLLRRKKTLLPQTKPFCPTGTKIFDPVAPVAYQVILEPGTTDQFREFKPRRVHTRINSLGLFLVVHKLTLAESEGVS